MKRDPHLLVSDEALKEGHDYTALCGRTITKAVWVWTDGDICSLNDFFLKLGQCCPRCRKHTAQVNKIYVYGAIDGELAIKEEL